MPEPVVLQEQKWLIGIIVMVPVYTITSVIVPAVIIMSEIVCFTCIFLHVGVNHLGIWENPSSNRVWNGSDLEFFCIALSFCLYGSQRLRSTST
jgi:uncharacterized membrane protein YiaA